MNQYRVLKSQEGIATSDAQTPTSSDDERLPLLAKVVLIALLIPAHFSIGSLSLNPSKVMFLVVVPVLLIKLLRGELGKILSIDVMVIGFTGWMTLAMLSNHSIRVAIEYTGSVTATLLGGYLTGRATIRSKANFIALIRFLAIVIVISLPFCIYETITSRTTIPRLMASLPGIRSHGDIQHDPRLGLWRVQFVFAHPIHFGIFCSLVFSLVFVGLKDTMTWFRRVIVAGIVGFCCFLSVSSGPVLALAVQIGLIGWAWVMKWSNYRWTIFTVLVVIGYAIIEVLSDRSGIYAVVQRLSFNPATAFSRRILFEYGIEQIGRTPFLGVGYNGWAKPAWMTGSVDNFWLFLSVTFGLPAFILLFGAFVTAMILAARRDFTQAPKLTSLRLGWIITMTSLVLSLATVAIWGELYSIAMLMLGSGAWFITTSADDVANANQNAPLQEVAKRLRYSRFPPNTADGAIAQKPASMYRRQ